MKNILALDKDLWKIDDMGSQLEGNDTLGLISIEGESKGGSVTESP